MGTADGRSYKAVMRRFDTGAPTVLSTRAREGAETY
jgi:hypothetical protein